MDGVLGVVDDDGEDDDGSFVRQPQIISIQLHLMILTTLLLNDS